MGSRGGEYEREALILSRPRWRFSQSIVTPGEAQRSGFAGKRRSKGTNAVFAARRKRSGVDFATTSRHGQSNSPPAGGEIPLRKEPSSGPMRASGPTKKRSIIAPSSVTASPCHLPPRGKAYGRPHGAAPTKFRGSFRFCRRGRRPRRPAGAHCAPLRRKTASGRWFGNGRRRSGTAATVIFFPLRPPVGPDGTALRHS